MPDSSFITGSFSYKFVRPGVYYYWSGPVDEYERIYMRGKVEVVAKASFVDTLKMTVANYEPIYKLGTQGSKLSSIMQQHMDIKCYFVKLVITWIDNIS